ncbi:putative ABC transport system ATP-binding protein [Catalinimonas alkaloidigena]|uniref:Putative ABC transport system ATP-binding protein n=2 Tax=Catalinimonas alkaloidigena TaxID=1075417 RepID=A0A1G9VFL9_9BACT|nr:putative ABC transport system ATP-binding protein [Catalinimonas alkaloidigena]
MALGMFVFLLRPMFRTRSLVFTYNKTAYFRFPDIELNAGEDLLIVGESGVGKTTLLHLMAGLLRPESGQVELLDTSLHELSSRQRDRFRGQYIGLVFQRPHFVRALSLEENLTLIQLLAGKKQDKNRIREVLHSLGMSHKLHEKPHRLSQGEQQRAALALAVVNRPRLILADEPTASLDDRNAGRVAALLKQQALASGAQLIIITHDRRLKDPFPHLLEL